jgi:23S rRNA (cytidine2498-2'-O)-methyltransferase
MVSVKTMRETQAIYLSHKDCKSQLQADIGEHLVATVGDLCFSNAYIDSVWALDVWFDPQVETVTSIADAQKKLKQVQKLWTALPQKLHRRTQLIADKLFAPKNPKFDFTTEGKFTPRQSGYFTLVEQDLMVYAQRSLSPFIAGVPPILEDREGPPARAYLKLVECLMRVGHSPKPNDLCLELGASPGSWTWVLLRLGAKVIAYDRSDLDPKVKKLGDVKVILKDAFTARPEHFDGIDWLFCDVICYPDKLYEFILEWIASGKCKNFVCTLKFQGAEHYDMIPKFRAIPGAKVFHSYYNKHELTFVRLNHSSLK